MNDHFEFGFTMTQQKMQKSHLQPQKRQSQSPLKQEQMQEQSSQQMLFMIGSKQIATKNNQKQLINIDLPSQNQSYDSDKTVNLKKQKTIKKHKKHKNQQHKNKNKKHKKQHKNKYHQRYEQQQEQFQQKQEVHFEMIDKEQGQLFSDQEVSQKKRKKQKKIKKHKNKDNHKYQSRYEDAYAPQGQLQSSAKLSGIKDQEDQNQFKLFPSLIKGQQRPLSITQESSLVPLPLHIKHGDPSKHLYTSYLQKLQQSSLLPARTIKQMSNSIVNKNQQFAFLYQNDDQRFDKQIGLEFFTNGKFPNYLNTDLKFDIIRFPTKQLYIYGKNMDKEIPQYQLIKNFNKVIGVKAKKQHKYEKMMREIYRSLNQGDFSYPLKNKRDKGNDDRYFHYEGYEKLQGENLVQRRQKLRILRNRENKQYTTKKLQKIDSDEQSNTCFVPFEDNKRKVAEQKELTILETQVESQFKQQTRLLNQQLAKNPNDIQLWLKLVNLQGNLFKMKQYSPNNQSNVSAQFLRASKMNMCGFILQKKLVILCRSLKSNQFNEILGEKYFMLLFQYLQQFDKKDLSAVSQCQNTQMLSAYLLGFINEHNTNPVFWLMYLKLKLTIEPIVNLMGTFNHTYIKQIFTQISGKISKMIEKQKSAAKIKKLRTISLLILQRILQHYQQQGYTQLALGIGVGLIEFNLFVPERVYRQCSKQADLERKKLEFKKYWEDYKQQRVGDLKYGERSCWQLWQIKKNQVIKLETEVRKKQRSKSYIGFRYQKEDNKQGKQLKLQGPNNRHNVDYFFNEIKLQQNLSERYWHMGNPLYQKRRIRESMQSLVLYEDVEKWLLNYRDSENILRLVNMLIAKGIGMLGVFDFQGLNSDIKDGDENINSGEILLKNGNDSGSTFERMLLKRCVEIGTQPSLIFLKHQTIMRNAPKALSINRNYSCKLRGRQTVKDKLAEQLYQAKYWPVQMTLQIFCFDNQSFYQQSVHQQSAHHPQSSHQHGNRIIRQSLNEIRQFDSAFLRKIVYTSRLLRVVSGKLVPALSAQRQYSRIYQLHQYRLFLLGVIYVAKSQLKQFLQRKQQQRQELQCNGQNKTNQRDKKVDNHQHSEPQVQQQEMRLLSENIMETDEDLLEEMKEIVGWYETNCPFNQIIATTNSKDDDSASNGVVKYDQLRLWAMYIHFWYLQYVSQKQGKNNINQLQLQKDNNKQKLSKCIECYQQLISIKISNCIQLKQYQGNKNKPDRQNSLNNRASQEQHRNEWYGFYEVLRVTRYYLMFLKQALTFLIGGNSNKFNYRVDRYNIVNRDKRQQNKNCAGISKERAQIWLSILQLKLVARISQSLLGSYQKSQTTAQQVSNLFYKAKRFIHLLNNPQNHTIDSQQFTLMIINPIQKLQLANCINELIGHVDRLGLLQMDECHEKSAISEWLRGILKQNSLPHTINENSRPHSLRHRQLVMRNIQNRVGKVQQRIQQSILTGQLQQLLEQQYRRLLGLLRLFKLIDCKLSRKQIYTHNQSSHLQALSISLSRRAIQQSLMSRLRLVEDLLASLNSNNHREKAKQAPIPNTNRQDTTDTNALQTNRRVTIDANIFLNMVSIDMLKNNLRLIYRKMEQILKSHIIGSSGCTYKLASLLINSVSGDRSLIGVGVQQLDNQDLNQQKHDTNQGVLNAQQASALVELSLKIAELLSIIAFMTNSHQDQNINNKSSNNQQETLHNKINQHLLLCLVSIKEILCQLAVKHPHSKCLQLQYLSVLKSISLIYQNQSHANNNLSNNSNSSYYQSTILPKDNLEKQIQTNNKEYQGHVKQVQDNGIRLISLPKLASING